MNQQRADDEGDVCLVVDKKRFKAKLSQLSPFIKELPVEDEDGMEVPVIRLPAGGIATSVDIEALLRLDYNLSQPIAQAQFVQTARILRAATEYQFPTIQEAALARFKELYPTRPAPFQCADWQYVHEATQLAIDCRTKEILPALLYAIVTMSDFDVESTDELPPGTANGTIAEAPLEDMEDHGRDDETRGRILPASTIRICVRLMKLIMEYFTPILFTVPTSSHMECTGVFADHWMDQAIQPAIIDSGVYKPLETLRKIQDVDWRLLGLCDACCKEKNEEWELQADDIWQRIEGWVDLETTFE